MKKLITRFWGVALIVVLLSSLFIAAAPTFGAEPLRWEAKTDAPSDFPGVGTITTDVTVRDFEFSGATMLAATGTGLYLSTMGGALPANIIARPQASTTTTANAVQLVTADWVAIAPDDPNVMVAVDATGDVAVTISTNGGATWSNMGLPTAGLVLDGVAISPLVTGGIRYIAVWGTGGTNTPVLYYYNYGAGVGGWANAVTSTAWSGWAGADTDGLDIISAFAFSPNFASDYIGMAVSVDLAGTDDILLHILNFNGADWDEIVAPGVYPESVYNPGAITINSIDIALPPDFDGSDESLRIAFIGAASNDTSFDGIWRYIDGTDAARIYIQAAIYSVDYDGTTLVGGAYASNNVVRSSDPLATAPTFLGARNLKRIGGNVSGATDAVLVKYDGETLYGSKQGNGGAISKSLDFGNTWNDFTMINTGFSYATVLGTTTVTDIAFNGATGDPWYIAFNDGTITNVFRVSMFASQRVLTLNTVLDLKLRTLESDAGVLYGFVLGGQAVYYTDNGGVSRWFQRSNIPAPMADLAVESAQTIYIGTNNSVNVYKSTNAGFTWSLPVNTRITAGTNVYSLTSVGENQLIVGGTGGSVTYSTDGGTTWTATFGVGFPFGDVTGGTIVQATGLAAGEYIFAAGLGTDEVYRCDLGPANFLGEFKAMNNPTAAGFGTYGLRLIDGVLYSISANGTTPGTTVHYMDHTLTPTALPVHTAGMWSPPVGPTAGAINTGAPNSLKVSNGPVPGNIYLYKASVSQGFVPDPGFYFDMNSVSYFQDDAALTGVTLLGPADDTLVQIASPLTGAVQPVNFVWSKLSQATGYQLQIALDENFTQPIALPAPDTGVMNGVAGGVNSTVNPVSSIQAGAIFSPGETYYWRVRIYTPVYSAWSETRSFFVQPTAASVPNISSPGVGDAIDNTNPAFSWSPVSGATSYRFELSEGISFVDPVYTIDTPVAGAQLPANMQLDRGTQYFWRVKALAPVESDWSTVGNFVVAEEETTAPPPAVTTTIITVPPPPAGTTTVVTVPPDVVEEVNPAYIWAIIIIGAVLVIAVIVLIVRTRRSV